MIQKIKDFFKGEETMMKVTCGECERETSFGDGYAIETNLYCPKCGKKYPETAFYNARQEGKQNQYVPVRIMIGFTLLFIIVISALFIAQGFWLKGEIQIAGSWLIAGIVFLGGALTIANLIIKRAEKLFPLKSVS